MNEAKAHRIEQSLNGIARKVLDATPVQDSWTAAQIVGEMQRLTGSNPDFRVVQGCLRRMVEEGLVREPRKGEFQRLRPRTAVKPLAKEGVVESKPKVVKIAESRQVEAEPLDVLANIAKQLREDGARMIAAADAIESVALGVEERLQRTSSDSAKLRQLQALLKGLGE